MNSANSKTAQNGDEFFDAISNNSFIVNPDLQEQNNEPDSDINKTQIKSKTILKYSDKNAGLTNQSLTQTRSQLNFDYQTLSNELHYFTFYNDLKEIKKTIERLKKECKDNFSLNDFLSAKDKHGNTPIHLAAMLGNLEAAKLLIESGAVVKSRNKQMWTPLNEAVSYGNRDLIKCILKKFEVEVDQIINDSKPKINMALKEMPDFYVEIKWDFDSWIPLISRFLPSDVCKLYKSGTKLRLDCTLEDIARSTTGSKSASKENSNSSSSPFNWQRGDLTFIFDLEKIGAKNSILFIDNKKKTYAYIDRQEDQQSNDDSNFMVEEIHDIEKEVDLLLSREMIYIKLDTDLANFVPTQVGWFTKRDKIESVNGYSCQYYDVENLFIVSKLRSEHLSEEDIRKKEEKQKQIKENFTKSNQSSKSVSSNLNAIEAEEGDFLSEIEFRPNLSPPPQTNINWDEYLNSAEGEWPHLGRKLRLKESKKEFKAQLAMSEEFPLTIHDLNKLLDALVPLAKFRKLKEFVSLKLPPGFPVKIDIPIVPTITAKVSFQNFKKDFVFTESLFKIPDGYNEENLADVLFKKQNNQSDISLQSVENNESKN